MNGSSVLSNKRLMILDLYSVVECEELHSCTNVLKYFSFANIWNFIYIASFVPISAIKNTLKQLETKTQKKLNKYM